ncbi:BTAD domain-containing putative transcriptional regulator [Actinocrispum sp. NPDC049592]|uniref:BTAD domain-containing putative transcriptional regulator n=1 Tax=Actinocrispum sp. NPDC049592 TaxID=3154835 RepID=UPI003446FEF5
MDYRVLGPLEVWSEGERLALPSSRHQRVLAALLLAPDTAVPVGKLVEAVWDGEPPATATKQVQNCVSALRDRLGSKSIVTEGPGYRVVVSEEDLDLLRFTNGIAAARKLEPADAVARMRKALALWRGPALDGLGAAALQPRATRLDEQRLAALEQCIDWQLALGEHREITDELVELTTQHPLRERLHAQLMSALAASGRQAEAIEVFQRLRTYLAEELGIDPSAELTRLHEKVLRGELSPRQATETVDAPPDQLDRAARELAAAVARQWSTEAELRSLNRPDPVPLTWSSTGRPVTTSSQQALSGGLTDLVAKFRQVPTRQLVVLGEPGAGKSVVAILLTLGLLKDLQPGEPVPVLFSLESWDPRREHLHRWLERRLTQDYPGLANKAAYGPDAPARLILDGRIMPILDGLDEIPPALHAAAIDALDQVASGDRPLVVTSRTEEYERATDQDGSILSRAAVVEIEPVGLQDAIDFLTARSRRGEARWQPVIDHLRRDPRGPLAQALRTPLMVDLARTAYSHPDSTPATLTEAADRTAVEDQLLDAYLPAAYEQRPEPLRHETSPAPVRYDPDQAHRWLTFLAGHLDRWRTRDLAWWRLDRALPRATRGLLLGLPSGLLFGLTGWLAGGPLVGWVYGLSFGLAGTIAHAVGPRPGPLRVEFRVRGTGRRFLARFGIGVLIGVALGLGWSLSPPLVAVLCVVFGLGVGSLVWVTTPVDANKVSSPGIVLSNDRVAAWMFMLAFTVSLGLFYGMAFAFTQEVRFVTIWDGHFDLLLAVAAGLASALLGRFMMGNVGALTYGAAGVLVGGQVFPRATSIGSAVLVGALFGLAVAVTFGLSRAWGAFVAHRAWLAVTGRMPVRLMRFLDDAHRRGVLRQVGALYQFRHARLQDRLSRTAGTGPAPGSRT